MSGLQADSPTMPWRLQEMVQFPLLLTRVGKCHNRSHLPEKARLCGSCELLAGGANNVEMAASRASRTAPRSSGLPNWGYSASLTASAAKTIQINSFDLRLAHPEASARALREE